MLQHRVKYYAGQFLEHFVLVDVLHNLGFSTITQQFSIVLARNNSSDGVRCSSNNLRGCLAKVGNLAFEPQSLSYLGN